MSDKNDNKPRPEQKPMSAAAVVDVRIKAAEDKLTNAVREAERLKRENEKQVMENQRLKQELINARRKT